MFISLMTPLRTNHFLLFKMITDIEMVYVNCAFTSRKLSLKHFGVNMQS